MVLAAAFGKGVEDREGFFVVAFGRFPEKGDLGDFQVGFECSKGIIVIVCLHNVIEPTKCDAGPLAHMEIVEAHIELEPGGVFGKVLEGFDEGGEGFGFVVIIWGVIKHFLCGGDIT